MEIEDHPSYELNYNKENKRFAVTDKVSNKTFHFTQKSGGKLYTYTPKTEATHIITIKEIRKQFMPRQNKNTNRAKKVLALLNYPSIQDFKTIIKTNALKNNPVLLEDIDIMEKIYRKDILSIKGKTTRKKTESPEVMYIPVPENILNVHKNVILCAEIMYVNGLTFFDHNFREHLFLYSTSS